MVRKKKVKFAQVPEKEIQDTVLMWLKLANYLTVRVPVGPIVVRNKASGKRHYRSNPMKGFPDIMGIMKNRPGQMFVIEMKSESGRLSPEQKEWRDSLQEAGVLWILAKDLATVVESLKSNDVADSL